MFKDQNKCLRRKLHKIQKKKKKQKKFEEKKSSKKRYEVHFLV